MKLLGYPSNQPQPFTYIIPLFQSPTRDHKNPDRIRAGLQVWNPHSEWPPISISVWLRLRVINFILNMIGFGVAQETDFWVSVRLFQRGLIEEGSHGLKVGGTISEAGVPF